MSDNKQEIITTEDIDNQIINSEISVKDLTYLFNENLIKQSMLRANRLSDLQNKVIDNLEIRIDKKPDNFTNKELLDALNVVQQTTDKNVSYINSINEKPQIQLVNNNLNVTVESDDISKESRDKIVDAVNSLMELIQQNSSNDNDTIEFLSDVDDETQT